jgi:hypothetical protein
MYWLTPRSWRLWIAVGLQGHTADGVVQPGWSGRLEDRNVAFTRLVVSSGLRRQEAGSLRHGASAADIVLSSPDLRTVSTSSTDPACVTTPRPPPSTRTRG